MTLPWPLSLRSAGLLSLVLIVLCGAPPGARAQEEPLLRIETHGTEEEAEGALDRLDASRIPTGLLHDRVIDLVDIDRLDGRPLSRVATLDSVRQLHHQLVRSAVRAEALRMLPDLQTLTRNAEPYVRAEIVPLAVTSIRYDRIKRDAPAGKNLRREERRQRALQTGETPSYETRLAFAAAPFKRQSYDHTVRFVIPPELYVVNHAHRATRFEVDFDDGQGLRPLAPGEVVTVRYATGGRKTIRVTAFEGAEAHHAVTAFEVAETAVPAPDQSWLDRAAHRPYAGAYAHFDAHIFYGAGNTRLTNPVVFIEGFDAYYSDPVKRRTWQDMYLIAAEEGVADTLRARGYDLVLMKLHNAADYVQRNAHALARLLDDLNAVLPEGREVVVIGPSMGGLIGRYALAFMERVGRPHNVRLFVSIDAPHRGGNIPLGDQFFLEFFDNDSDKAKEGKLALNTVAARQQLLYHYGSYPGTDPLRKELMRHLTFLGYPHIRMVTMADGSGNGLAQRGNERVGFRLMQPGDKIVEYRYRSFLIDLDGDVWAVPDTADGWTQIFEGRKDVIGPHYRSQNVYVKGTLPLDNAPGGIRATQGEIAGGDTPYGQIYTSFPEHAWIPTVSALDLGDVHPFYDLQSDPQHLLATDAAGKTSTSTFEAVFYPAENEAHVKANTTNAAFLLAQIGPVPELPLAVAPPLLQAVTIALPEGYALSSAFPNPFNPQTQFTLSVASSQEVRVEVFNALGQRVAVLHDGLLEAGKTRQLVFDAGALSSGVYLLRATGDAFLATRTMTLLK